MSNGTNIKVAVRVRPLMSTELKQGVTSQKIECEQGQIKLHLDEKQHKLFKFDYVMNESTEQIQFYQKCEVEMLLNQALEGYHATIFAYGQTGSGKTYTMQGESSEDDMGVIPRTIRNLFLKIGQQSNTRQFNVYCSYLQLYNEKIYDLLGGVGKINAGPQGAGLRLRWNPRDMFTVENLFVYQCRNSAEVLDLFTQGNKNRVTSAHKLNLMSSRSHSILELKIESVDLTNPDSILTSKLTLVDLAGSERITQTGAEGRQAKETIDINKSLFTLRQVITAVSEQSKNPNAYAPYRDSKLTSLLKHCIGGNSFCLMIACVVPGDSFSEENISTLAYASKATTITNIPQKNDDPRNLLIQELRTEVIQLKDQLNNAQKHIVFLSSVVQGNAQEQPNKTYDPPKHQDSRIERNIERKLEALQNHLDDSKESSDNNKFSDRLVDSINMVRELLLSNKELREREEHNTGKSEQLKRELVIMQKENSELRERLHSQQSQQEDPNIKKKAMSNQVSSHKRPYQFNQDDIGFIPEQTTQFQKQGMFVQQKSIHQQQIRNTSLPPKQQAQQLPQIKYIQNQINNSAAQQFFNDEDNSYNYDELTNFGRRTLFQNTYNTSHNKFRSVHQSFDQTT